MRIRLLILTCMFVCLAPPAFAQARVLIAPSPVPLPDEQASSKNGILREHEGVPVRAQAEPAPAAQEQAPPNEIAGMNSEPADVAGRFTFERVKDGVLRLDRVGGEVSFCQPDGTGWVCATVPQDRAALEKEIERLREEVASLKREIAGLNNSVQPPRPPQTVPPSPETDKTAQSPIKLPNADDVARARAFLVETWHRLVEIIDNWQKDVLRKT